MTADKGILDAGSTFRANRNGHPYDPTSGARTGALDPNGEHPDIGFGGFSMDELIKLAGPYNGNVTVINSPSDIQRLTYNDEGAIDFFTKHTDGLYYRSNRWGTITWELRDLKPDNSGVIATGEVTGQGSTAAPEPAPQPVVNGQTIGITMPARQLNRKLRVGRQVTLRWFNFVNGTKGNLRIAEHGTGVDPQPAIRSYSLTDSASASTPMTETGESLDMLWRCDDSKPLGWDNDAMNVHSGTIDMTFLSNYQEGVEEGLIVVDMEVNG